MGSILPPAIAAAECRGDAAGAVLFHEERVAVERAVESRRREFATGRACARAALGRLGLSPRAIPAGPKGEPRWPAGVLGSITHCRDYRAAVVAREADFAAIGIDAEPDLPLPEGVLEAIACGEEAGVVRRLTAAEPAVCWDRLLFSAKEAAFKAWFRLARRRLPLREISIHFEPRAGAFAARLPPPEGTSGLGTASWRCAGRWTVDDSLLLTCVAVPS